MSLYHSEESCVYCKAKLFSDDDVVYCPVCGAPHHRDCYNSIGHCALEALHGTEEEYSKEKELEKLKKQREEKEKEKDEAWINLDDDHTNNSDSSHNPKGYYNTSPDTVRCKMCGEIYESRRNSCPKCNAPNFVRYNGVAFDFLGGVPADQEVDDGITADDAKKFVLVNTPRYIPKFAAFRNGKRASWNWLAFLFPSCWMFSRKMNTGGLITGVLLVIADILSLPLQLALVNLGVFNNSASYTELFKNIYDAVPSIDQSIMLLSFASVAISLTLKIICGIFGDYWYKKHAMSAIRKIRAESHDSETDHRKKGGVNVFAFLICYMILSYLPQILLALV